ncbi:unnamed protein product, partial [Ixodes pacificus]
MAETRTSNQRSGAWNAFQVALTSVAARTVRFWQLWASTLWVGPIQKKKGDGRVLERNRGSLIKPEVAEQPRVTSLGRACLRFRHTSWQRPLVIELGDTVATGPPRDGGYSSNGPALGREQ